MEHRIRRHPERSRPARDELDGILDAGFVATLATVADGEPWVVPMLYARDGDRILLHGSTGAGALRHVAAGTPVALCVTHLDGIVVAESTYDSSANYRSAVVRGVPVPLTAADKERALTILADAVIPGRSAEVRHNTAKEYAATLAMALPIVAGMWTAKIRTGAPSPATVPTLAWQGVVPVRQAYGAPEPVAGIAAPVPDSVRALIGRGAA